MGLVLALGFAAGALLSWVALGQSLSHLSAFMAGACTFSKDYNLSWGVETDPAFLTHGILTMLCVSATVLFRSVTAFSGSEKATYWRRGLLLLWSGGLLFMIWKHGFVFGDAVHVVSFLAAVPVLALAFGALPSRTPAAAGWGRKMALACCCYVFASPVRNVGDQFTFLSFDGPGLCERHLHNLLRPTDYWRQMGSRELAAARGADLRRCRQIIGRASVDVFGFNQSFALYNQLNYRPRPVFQSHTAFSPPLMRLNERFYLDPSTAPEYVLFRLSTTFRKFPPAEDSLVLRFLLQNYQPVEAEGPFLLLRSKSHAPCSLTLLREGSARPGDAIELKDLGGQDTWLEIDLRPTWLGRLWEFLYKPPHVWLTADCDGLEQRETRSWAPARMLEAGFLASPLVLDNLQALHLYAGEGLARPRAYSVETSWAGLLYRTPLHYRIYRIENPLGRCAAPELAARLEPIVRKQLSLPSEGVPSVSDEVRPYSAATNGREPLMRY
jgi:hypothetical protein